MAEAIQIQAVCMGPLGPFFISQIQTEEAAQKQQRIRSNPRNTL
jgi:hypothetical protein